MPPSHCRLTAANLVLLVLATLQPEALQAGQSGLIWATGTVDPTASVEVPAVQTSDPPVIASDGRSMTVANAEPVTLSATIPSRVELSPLQLTAPNGVPPSSVAANISLRRPNGDLLVGASTSGGSSQPFGVGQVEASVNASFYSTSDQALPPGAYTATTTVSMVAD